MRTDQTRSSLSNPVLFLLGFVAATLGAVVPMLTYSEHSDTLVYLVLFSVIVVTVFASLFVIGGSSIENN